MRCLTFRICSESLSPFGRAKEFPTPEPLTAMLRRKQWRRSCPRYSGRSSALDGFHGVCEPREEACACQGGGSGFEELAARGWNIHGRSEQGFGQKIQF